MNGSDIILEALHKEGVDTIFGYPGGANLGFYDRLYDHKFKHILPRHEQGGIHAAEGYAKATGKVGVCLATSGPGATNLVTGIANAYMDSAAIVVLAAQATSDLIGKDAFQEVDIIGITRPVVKHSYLVRSVDELAQTVKEAFHIASTGRPGPVVIDLPKDVLATTYKGKFTYSEKINLPGYQPNYEGHPMQIKKIMIGLTNAKKPLILIGGGIALCNASEVLERFVDFTGIPVTSTFMGLGGFPANHPLNLGWLGMHGNYASNNATIQADFILAIGTRFSDRSTGNTISFAPNATIAHVDIDPTSISKNIPVRFPIVGDAKVILEQLLKYKKEYDNEKNKKAHEIWVNQLMKWGKEKPFSFVNSDTVIKPQYVVEQIYKITSGDAIICTDVGQHQMWAGQFYKFDKPNQFITSGGLGTMGFGVPAAVGAKIGMPNKTVFAISGDGSFVMNAQEIITAVQYKVAIKVAILNNTFLGMPRQWQELFFNKRYSQTLIDVQPDFVKLAEAYGAIGLRAEKPSEVDEVLKKAMAINDLPVIMDFRVEKEENVFPIVPAGAGLEKMILN